MRLLKFRKRHGLKQSEIATMLGVTAMHISNIERGRVSPSAALAFSIDELIRSKGSEPPNLKVDAVSIRTIHTHTEGIRYRVVLHCWDEQREVPRDFQRYEDAERVQKAIPMGAYIGSYELTYAINNELPRR